MANLLLHPFDKTRPVDPIAYWHGRTVRELVSGKYDRAKDHYDLVQYLSNEDHSFAYIIGNDIFTIINLKLKQNQTEAVRELFVWLREIAGEETRFYIDQTLELIPQSSDDIPLGIDNGAKSAIPSCGNPEEALRRSVYMYLHEILYGLGHELPVGAQQKQEPVQKGMGCSAEIGLCLVALWFLIITFPHFDTFKNKFHSWLLCHSNF